MPRKEKERNMQDKNKIVSISNGRTRQAAVDVKVFASEKRMYQSKLVYYSNGEKVETSMLGNPSGQDLRLNVDEGTWIKVISGYGRATHFKTDDTFSKKVHELSDHILVKAPMAGGHSMFVVDAHLGSAHQVIREVILAFGDLVGAEISFEERVRNKKEDAA